jgi:hypothetical protein
MVEQPAAAAGRLQEQDRPRRARAGISVAQYSALNIGNEKEHA